MNARMLPYLLPDSVPVSAETQLIPGYAPGCFSLELSAAAYHADRRYLSSTGCKRLLRSPAHFAQHAASAETASQRLGQAVHCAVLEPDRFAADYVLFDGERRGAAWTAFRRRHSAADILTRNEWDAVTGMRDALLSFRPFPVSDLVAASACEQSIFFIDADSGVPCKIRCDAANPHLILDLKTTDDARGDAFLRQAMKLHYEVQAAMYIEGSRHFYGQALPFYFVVVETHPPYGVMVHRAGDTFIETGRRRWRRSLAAYRQCMASGQWPCYDDPLSVLDMPPWATLLE